MGRRIAGVIATTAGIGYLPFAPGTWAAALSALLWYEFYPSVTWQALLTILLITAGVYSSSIMVREGEKDPGYIVIDEFAGMWLSLLFIPTSIINVIVSFVLFRFFDIVKPLGIRKMERLKKGWGIMMDDILAGIYSNIVLQVIVYFKVW